jgi:pimeloyl-ACP methyl ester carboxylesterase
VPEVVTEEVRLHVEVDGEGHPISVLAHGLTNSCRELALLTPLVPGTKVRFCFRGHGHSSSPERGYKFADFARDVDTVATAYDAEVAVGTSLLSDPERVAAYLEDPWLRDMDREMLGALNPVGVPRAIREVIEDWPLRDREDMRRVAAPTLLICRRGDVIHPAEVGEILAGIMPNAELMMFEDGRHLYESIPVVVGKVREFLLA